MKLCWTAPKESILKNSFIKLQDDDFDKPNIIIDHLENEKLLVRNELSHAIMKIINIAFREIASIEDNYTKDLLEYCYVKNVDIKKYNSELDVIFEDNPPSFDDRILKARNTESISEQIKEKICESNAMIHDINTPLIVIIGGKGSGKTTFLKHFFEVFLRNEIKKNRPSIYIDFRKFTENEIKNTESIYFHILEELNNKYKNLNLNSRGVLEQIYRKEINDCKNGIWKGYDSNKIQDKISEYLEKKTTTYSFHLEKISKYLLNSGKRISIIFDNVINYQMKVKKIYLFYHKVLMLKSNAFQ